MITYLQFQLGIDAAFDEGQFEKIRQNSTFKVSQVKHRATVEVTKDGTIGAAASAIELVPLSADLEIPKKIDIDKPFLFFIRDNVLKTVLFAGKYTNPETNPEDKC